MNSFSNAMMQRHLGQVEMVSPRPQGLYEPVQNTGIENLDQIEQNLTDKGQDVTPLPLNEAKRSIHPPEVQTPYPPIAKEWPMQELVHPKIDSRQTDPKTLQMPPPLLTSEFQAPVPSIPLLITPAITQSPSVHNLNSQDIQEQKTEQVAQRQLIQSQIERRIETHLEPIMKTDNAVGMVQPAAAAINLESLTPFTEQFAVPLPKMNHPPAAPVIRISIGRIEVKAVIQTPSQPVKSSPSPKPRMSLDEYLKKQDNR